MVPWPSSIPMTAWVPRKKYPKYRMTLGWVGALPTISSSVFASARLGFPWGGIFIVFNASKIFLFGVLIVTYVISDGVWSVRIPSIPFQARLPPTYSYGYRRTRMRYRRLSDVTNDCKAAFLLPDGEQSRWEQLPLFSSLVKIQPWRDWLGRMKQWLDFFTAQIYSLSWVNLA